MKFVFILMTFYFVAVQAQIVNEESDWVQVQEIREKSIQKVSSFEDAQQQRKVELQKRREQVRLSMEKDLQNASKKSAARLGKVVGKEVRNMQREEAIDEKNSENHNAIAESDSQDSSFDIVILCIIAFLLIIFASRYVYLHSAQTKSKVRSI